MVDPAEHAHLLSWMVDSAEHAHLLSWVVDPDIVVHALYGNRGTGILNETGLGMDGDLAW